jgi:hypothetical protein
MSCQVAHYALPSLTCNVPSALLRIADTLCPGLILNARVVDAGSRKSLVVAVGDAPNAMWQSWSDVRKTTVHELATPLVVAAAVAVKDTA